MITRFLCNTLGRVVNILILLFLLLCFTSHGDRLPWAESTELGINMLMGVLFPFTIIPALVVYWMCSVCMYLANSRREIIGTAVSLTVVVLILRVCYMERLLQTSVFTSLSLVLFGCYIANEIRWIVLNFKGQTKCAPARNK